MQTSDKPKIIVTNDDGVDSPFLSILALALLPFFDVRIVAPLTEQSWIGKAISRRGRVHLHRKDVEGIPSWAIEGTPADCVNIALGNLFSDERIAAVVSGINIGYNASLATVLSSGTVGAALEASLMGVPSVALSKSLPQESFEQLQRDRSVIPDMLRKSLESDAARVPEFVNEAILLELEASDRRIQVHNYNFPHSSTSDTDLRETSLAHTSGAGIFEKTEGEGDSFEFRYREGQNIDTRTKTDLNCLSDGHISYSLIDFTRLSHL